MAGPGGVDGRAVAMRRKGGVCVWLIARAPPPLSVCAVMYGDSLLCCVLARSACGRLVSFRSAVATSVCFRSPTGARSSEGMGVCECMHVCFCACGHEPV